MIKPLNFAPRLIHPMSTVTEWTTSGVKVLTDDQRGFVQGAKLFVVSPEGEIPAPDGKYEMESGNIFQVKEGLIISISNPVKQMAAGFEQIKKSLREKSIVDQIQRNAHKKNSNLKIKAR